MSTIDSTSTPPTSSYPPPVDKLLTMGEAKRSDPKDWPDYLAIGLTAEHIPDLIRMATDEELNTADSESLEVWAPTHAWRALGQLHALESIKPLYKVFDILEDYDNEWAIEEFPQVFALMGPSALSILEAFVADKTNNENARVNASTGVARIGQDWPDARSESIRILGAQLDNNNDNEELLSGFIVLDLAEYLKATEAAPSIERAFAEDRVDLSIVGDWDEAQGLLGLISPEELEQRRALKRTVQPPFFSPLAGATSLSGFSSSSNYENPASSVRGTSKKAKNKMAKQSRKKNRKR